MMQIQLLLHMLLAKYSNFFKNYKIVKIKCLNLNLISLWNISLFKLNKQVFAK